MYNNRTEPIDHYEDAYETIDRLREEITEAENRESDLRKQIKALEAKLEVSEAILKVHEEALNYFRGSK